MACQFVMTNERYHAITARGLLATPYMQGFDKVADGKTPWPSTLKVAVQESPDQAGTIKPPIKSADTPAPADVPGASPAFRPHLNVLSSRLLQQPGPLVTWCLWGRIMTWFGASLRLVTVLLVLNFLVSKQCDGVLVCYKPYSSCLSGTA
jgi:hypothetical protein